MAPVFSICIVYKYESPRGKTYIGQTTQDLDERTAQHVSMATKSKGTTNICRELRYHYRMYGEEDIYFSFKVIRILPNRNRLNFVEDEEIYNDQLENPEGNLNMIGGKYRRHRK